LGWTANTVLEQSIKQQKATELDTLLNTEVTTLEVWFDSHKVFAGVVARDPTVRDLVARLAQLGTDREVLIAAPEQQQLLAFMAPLARAQNYVDYVITGSDGVVRAAPMLEAVGNQSRTRHYQFILPALAGDVMVSRPFRAEMPLPDDTGVPTWGRPTMFVAASILGADGVVIAALGLRIRPEVDFTRILHVARPGETGETDAFDVNGLMVSQSRFDNDLREIGLLPSDTSVRAIFNIEIKDPGGNMAREHTPTSPLAKQPLTRMAEHAISGGDGLDVDGYRDYRGVDVIGAWRGLDDYGFGIATEVYVDEAYVALHRVRWLFRGLFASWSRQRSAPCSRQFPLPVSGGARTQRWCAPSDSASTRSRSRSGPEGWATSIERPMPGCDDLPPSNCSRRDAVGPRNLPASSARYRQQAS
jgi:hypothetical protein